VPVAANITRALAEPLPKSGRLEVDIKVTADIGISAYAGRQKVNAFVLSDISYVMHAGDPTFVLTERIEVRPDLRRKKQIRNGSIFVLFARASFTPALQELAAREGVILLYQGTWHDPRNCARITYVTSQEPSIRG
jgi:hypothetical protein